MRVVIAAGGTAGHVNPALALAGALEGEEVHFVGTPRGLEAELVPAAGHPLHALEVSGLDRSRPLRAPAVAARAAGAVVAAHRLLGRLRPRVVVGMGGYVSLPVCVAGALRRIPVVIHEQNIVLGLANRVARPLAARVAVSFAETLPTAGRRGVLTGNPVRPEIAGLDRARARAAALARFGLEQGRSTLLVFGGSQGARRINEAGAGLASLWQERADLQVLHVAGRAHAADLSGATRAGGGLIYRVVDYLPDMAPAYACADLVLCRGGATTVAELTAVGLPAIVVPYPYHRDRQQERHARVLERAGAAVVLPDSEATAEAVAGLASDLLADRGRLERMADAARSLGRPEAAGALAAVVREVAR